MRLLSDVLKEKLQEVEEGKFGYKLVLQTLINVEDCDAGRYCRVVVDDNIVKDYSIYYYDTYEHTLTSTGMDSVIEYYMDILKNYIENDDYDKLCTELVIKLLSSLLSVANKNTSKCATLTEFLELLK